MTMSRKEFLQAGAALAAGSFAPGILAAAPGAADAGEARLPATFGVNARDFGAVGDGKADDTAALQRALDAIKAPVARNGVGTNKTIFLPAGRYRITGTLRLQSEHSAIELIGSGAPWSHTDPTVIHYDGPAQQPALLMRGVNQSILRNLAIDGGGKARAAIEVQTVRGVAATGMSFTRLKLGNAEHGVLIGDDGIGHNGDCSSFYEIYFHDCSYGFRTVADQNMEYTFLRCGIANAKVGYWFQKGGDATFLHAGGYNAETYIKFDAPGINNGNLTVIGLRYEHYRRPRGTLLEAGADANVSFIGLCTTVTGIFADEARNLPADRTTPNFILRPGAQVRVSGSLLSGATARLEGSPGHPAWISFDDCRFKHSDDPRTDIQLAGNAGFELRNCTLNGGMIRSFARDQTTPAE
jgi:hypothetical protein